MNEFARGLELQRRREEQEREALLLAQAPFRVLPVDNPLAARELQVPRYIRLGNGRIEWRGGWETGWRADGVHPPNLVPVPEDSCLAAFIRLADEQDDAVFVSFAQRYGVLGLCPVPKEQGKQIRGVKFFYTSDVEQYRADFAEFIEQAMNIQKGQTLRFARAEAEHWYPSVRDKNHPPSYVERRASREKQWFWEPIEGWRAYAREARAILNIAIALRAGEQGGSDYWRVLEPSPQILLEDDRVSSYADLPIRDQRTTLGFLIRHRWLANAGVTLSFHWLYDGPPRLYLETGGLYGPDRLRDETDPAFLNWPLHSLFSTLALQLAGAVCADERLVQCAKCGNVFLYEGKRRPRADQPHYCSDACYQEARREDKREHAAKKRAAQRVTATLTAKTSDNH